MIAQEKPMSPVSEMYQPATGIRYTVASGDSWVSLAKSDPWDLIDFNFPGMKAASQANREAACRQVNWYLYEYVGCRLSNDDRNFAFTSLLSMGRGVHKGGVIFLSAAPPKVIMGPLRLGSNGDGVRILQTLLNGAPWNARLDVDGVFGIMTHRALIEFQRKRALRTDGVVGPKTAAALGLSYNSAPVRPIAPVSGGTLRLHLPNALEVIADALAPPMIDFMKLIRGEILRTGAEEDKIQNAAESMDEVIVPDMLKGIKDWSQSPIGMMVALDLQNDILESINEILGQILPYLKKHGGNVRNVVARIEKLDDTAIARIVQFMVDGRENADAAAWDIQQVMRRALA